MGRVFASSLLVAAVVTGCGGDDSSDDSPTSKAEFIRQADPICEQSQERSQELEAQLETAQETNDYERMAELLRRGAEQTEEFGAELRELEPPPGDAEVIERWLSTGESVADTGRQLADALDDRDLERAQTLRDEFGTQTSTARGIAQGYGFEVCGAG